jgi:hypothetical protein
MSYLLFMDESGHDRVISPREVLAGVAIEDRDLWNFIGEVHQAEIRHFGRRVSAGLRELKGEKLLKRKVFRHAGQMEPMELEGRRRLAKACLGRGDTHRGDPSGGNPTRAELTALGQAKLAFVEEILTLCARYRIHAFASIIPQSAPRTEGDFLRKDYAFLFERYFYFLEDRGPEVQGLVIFDERERSQSHLLINQLTRYFRDTAKGRMRASRVIPEPFVVGTKYLLQGPGFRWPRLPPRLASSRCPSSTSRACCCGRRPRACRSRIPRRKPRSGIAPQPLPGAATWLRDLPQGR